MTTLEHIVRRPAPRQPDEDEQAVLAREWLLTNGLGGYGCGTISGACTRRYHGLLVAALPAPLGRYVMLDQLWCEIEIGGRTYCLDKRELTWDSQEDRSAEIVGEFRLEAGLPIWEYEIGGVRIEKRVLLPHLQNTVCIAYRLCQGDVKVRLRLRPAIHFRPHDAPLCQELRSHDVSADGARWEIIAAPAPPLRLRASGPSLTMEHNAECVRHMHYGAEHARGYDYSGTVWSPGYFEFTLGLDDEAAVWASTERWDVFEAFEPATLLAAELERRSTLLERAAPEAREGLGAELVLAADQFIILPNTRPADEAIAEAIGEQARTMIAGYHWFTDWGRDTMISLEGLTLVTGRHDDARHMLHTFSRYARDGLLPNLFPEGKREGLYHTADATLWYFHALSRYWQATQDRETLELVLPILRDIVDWHIRGTHFGIRVDPADGLLSQGAAGYQLTWMDAKVGDWVVTPRRGKAVEINALWYNALRLLEAWLRETGDEAAAGPIFERAAGVYESFNRRFWNGDKECLYDVVDGEQGNDGAFRPNQLLAISLEHPVLNSQRWPAVVNQVAARLLSPVGLRTLASDDPAYKSTYDGDLRSRDAAYHQGTVWAWLIGPFIDAWCRLYPDRRGEAARMLDGFERHLGEACVGSISEVFDARRPHHPRGCVAQAWSVAEVLRCWARTRPNTGSQAASVSARQPGVRPQVANV